MNPGASTFPVAYWRLSSAALVQPCGPGQPAEPASGPPVGGQDERGDDLDAVDRERKGVGVPAGLAVVLGELAHMAVAERSGDSGQPGLPWRRLPG